jgi:CRISPR-associated protein Csb2
MITRALRGAVIASCPEPVPAWVSGHNSDGSALDDETGHLAFLPIPFAGREHADGHLLGVAMAFPRSIERRERGRVLAPLLLCNSGQPKDVILTLGRLGAWTFRKHDWAEGRRALMPTTWTAHPHGSTTWASVTPVVLDRFPKTARRDPKQREAREQEVRVIIAGACRRIGLQAPAHIDIDTTSWHRGSPRAIAKRRPIRTDANGAECPTAAFGDGFPRYPAKGAKAPRPQVHAFLQFSKPVLGPVLLGAGRYRGYGLFKPWRAPQ